MLTASRTEMMIKRTGGVPVTLGAVTTWGHRDTEQVPVLDDGAEVMATRDRLKVATGILSGVAQDAAITVDGESLYVGDAYRIEDGSITVIELVEEPYG